MVVDLRHVEVVALPLSEQGVSNAVENGFVIVAIPNEVAKAQPLGAGQAGPNVALGGDPESGCTARRNSR